MLTAEEYADYCFYLNTRLNERGDYLETIGFSEALSYDELLRKFIKERNDIPDSVDLTIRIQAKGEDDLSAIYNEDFGIYREGMDIFNKLKRRCYENE